MKNKMTEKANVLELMAKSKKARAKILREKGFPLHAAASEREAEEFLAASKSARMIEANNKGLLH